MANTDVHRELEEKRDELREKGKADRVGHPYETRRDAVEEGERKRSGTNLDLGEERSEEQLRELRRIQENGSE